ncbi:MAG: hypothetical protein Q4G04_04635 [bacterium]|nr:hypothetical protein [bacterium]
MKMEKEITVLVKCSYDELHKQLINKGFEIKEEYELNDNYMIDFNVDIKILDKLSILKKCILVRNIVGIKKVLLYKYKKYDDNGNILEQGKTECPIEDIKKAIDFMKAINYKELFKIYDKCIVYSDGIIEIVVQLVNDKYVFIEMESTGDYTDNRYDNIDDMKRVLDSYNLPYNKDNYFVKKAELMLTEVLKKEVE